MNRKLLLLLPLYLLSNTLWAQGLTVQLSDDSARFMFSTEAWGQQYGELDLELGGLYTEDDDYMFTAGLLVRNDSLDTPVIVSVGTRLYYASVDYQNTADYSVASVTIGIEALVIPDNLGGLGFGAYYFTGPSVVSFGDAEGFTEYGYRVSYQITPQANLYVGYQKIETEIENQGLDITIDKGGVFGIDLRF